MINSYLLEAHIQKQEQKQQYGKAFSKLQTYDDSQYNDHLFLVCLAQMGFTDAKVNLSLLKQTKGHLPSALEILLNC